MSILVGVTVRQTSLHREVELQERAETMLNDVFFPSKNLEVFSTAME